VIEIIVISIISWWLAVGLGFVQYLKWWLKIKRIRYEYTDGLIKEKRLRPIDCSKCMGFWIALIYTYIKFGNCFQSLVWAILCSAIAILIEKGMERL
jgi:hypothetical protein